MSNPERIVKYIGFSKISDEKGNHTIHLHTSNNSRYSVWSDLPDEVQGPGCAVTFFWFKLPANTNKRAAVKFLLDKENLSIDNKTRNFLEDELAKLAPKVPQKRGRKPGSGKKTKEVKVTVEAPRKRLSDEEAAKIKAANAEKVRALMAARKKEAAA